MQKEQTKKRNKISKDTKERKEIKKVSSKTYAETDTRGEMSTNIRTRGTKSEQ